MYEIEEIIKNEFLNTNNKKVKNETINEYLKSLKNEELTRFAVTQVFVDEDYYNLYKVKDLNHKPKDYIIDYILENIDLIIEAYVKIIRRDEIDQLKIVIKNNNKKIKFGDKPISIHFINFLKMFSLAKVEYNKNDDSLKFFMPEGFIDIFNKSLKNKKLLEINEQYNDVFDYSKSVIDTYGIVTLNKLHDLFEKQMFKINKDELLHIFSSMNMYEEFEIHEYKEEVLLCNIEFNSEESALNFYKKQEMEYKDYSKEDYGKISKGTYVDRLDSYKKFVSYLVKNYIGIYKDIDFIRDFIVIDYIITAQTSLVQADENFKINIEKIIEADDNDIEEILKLVKNIFKEHPKWHKKGNI